MLSGISFLMHLDRNLKIGYEIVYIINQMLLILFLFYKVCDEKIPDIGLIPLKSDLAEEYAGDVLKDLPVLERYICEFFL